MNIFDYEKGRLKRTLLLNTVATVVAITSYSTTAYSQESDSNANRSQNRVYDEIIVTAQKRSESLKDVPIAITALSEDALIRADVHDVSDLGAIVPNVQAGKALGITSVFLRGVGTAALGIGSDASVAYHADGVYVARPRAQVVGLFDVARLEVVRGPQGDLYGRNATGGSLNIITKKPTDTLSANLRASYGNYNAIRIDGGIGGPIVEDVVSARVAGYYNRRDGYGINIISGNDVDGVDEIAGRLTLQIDPSPKLSVELIADVFEADDSLGAWHYLGQGRPDVPLVAVGFGGVTASNVRDIASTADAARNIKTYGLTSTITYDVSDNLTFKSITGYRNEDYTLLTDLSGGSVLGATLTQEEDQDQFSQEIQILTGGERWNVILGGYYFTEEIVGDAQVPLFFFPGALFRREGLGKTSAYAAFAHADYQLTDKLKIIGGLRYSEEKRKAVGTFTAPAVPIPVGGTATFDAITPKIALEYKANDDLMLYSSASRGFKSGGFILGAPGAPTQPEFLWSYEVGAKATMFGGRVQTNLAGFYYDYKDLVVARVVGASVINENAANATIKGLEAEVLAHLSDNFVFNWSLGYLDAKYGEYNTADPVFLGLGVQDLSGNRLSNAPSVTSRIGGEYRADIGNSEIRASADLAYIGKVYFTPFNEDNAVQKGFTTLNARIGYTFESGVSVTAYGQNLTNELAVQSQIISADFLGFPQLGSFNAPRTYGIELGYKF